MSGIGRRAGIIAVTAAAAAVLLLAGYLLTAAFSGEEDTPIDCGGTVIYAEGEAVHSLSRFSGSGYAEELCPMLRTSPLTWLEGLWDFGAAKGHSASEKLALMMYPEAGRLEMIARARSIERQLETDEKIAEYYCAALDFGGIIGAQEAAAYYFGKPLFDLQETELSALKSIAENPGYYGLTPNELSEKREFSDVKFSADFSASSVQGSFYRGLLSELRSVLGGLGVSSREADRLIYSEGLRVYSTMDISVQQRMDEVITNQDDPGFFQMAAVATDLRGRVLGCSGGIGNSALDRTAISRSVGSAIKPLSVYAPAIEAQGAYWSQLLPDAPIDPVSGWPKNFDGKNDGNVTLAFALRRSKNTCAVYLLEELGTERSASFLSAIGIKLGGSDRTDMGLGLGYLEDGITPLELCAAYQIFGSGGIYTAPTYIDKIELSDGTLLYEAPRDGKRVISEETAYIVNRLMRSNVVMPDGLGNAAAIDGVEVCGKTGTVDNSAGVVTDNWFAGVTPDYAAVVWVGSDDENITHANGITPAPAVVWRSIFSEIPTSGGFSCPDGVVAAEFCRVSGGLASGGCTDLETGYFSKGALPEECDIHSH